MGGHLSVQSLVAAYGRGAEGHGGWAMAIAVSRLAAGLSSGALMQDRIRDQDRLCDPIYGSQLMTQQRRSDYLVAQRWIPDQVSGLAPVRAHVPATRIVDCL